MTAMLTRSVTTSFRTHLTLLFVGAALSVSLFIFFYFPGKISEQAIGSSRAKARSIAEISSYSTAPALYFDDLDAINEVIAAARQNAEITYVIITDQSLKRIAEYRNTDEEIPDNFDSASKEGTLSVDHASVMVRTSLTYNGLTIGYLFLGLSLKSINEETAETQRSVAFISLIILAAGAGLVFIAGRLFIRPLNDMAVTFQRISEGDLTQHVQPSGYEEMNRLGVAFNRMVNSLASLKEELTAMNRSLEERIAQRTKDLQQEVELHQRTEVALRESEERYRALIELSPDAVVVQTAQALVYVNPSAVTLFQVASRECLLNRSLFDFMHPSQAELFSEALERIRQGSLINLRSEQVFVCENNAEFHAEVAATPMHYRQEPAVQIVIRDITQRIRNERQRMDLEQQLMHVQKKEIISTLASGLAHDILNILGIIGTSINKLLFLKNLNQESVMESAEQIAKASERGKSLVRQLLSFARKSELNFDSVQINTVVAEITSVIHRTFPPAIAIRNELASDLPLIRADQNQMHQALLNLCLNARDAIQDSGVITIATTASIQPSSLPESAVHGPYMCISVSDDGIGMSEEVQRRIFEPFFTTKPEGTGSGLGMAMVKGIMDNHRGCIEIDSAEGKGTTFRLFFPV